MPFRTITLAAMLLWIGQGVTNNAARGQFPGSFSPGFNPDDLQFGPGGMPLDSIHRGLPPRGPKPWPASGSAEFDDLMKQWTTALRELGALQVKYKTVEQPERPPIEKEFNELRAKAENLQTQLLKAAEAGFAAKPANEVFLRYLGSYAEQCFRTDRYEEALRVAELLLAGKYEHATVYDRAFKAAFYLCEFDKAEQYLKSAEEKLKTRLDPDLEAQRLKELLPLVKPLWAKEQELRKAEEAARGDKAKALPQVELVTNEGMIVVELFENEAPNTVANFISLVDQGFYDGLQFYRVANGDRAITGDKANNGTSGPGYRIACECNEPHRRLHFRGAVSMENDNYNQQGIQIRALDAGGSKFSISFRPAILELDGLVLEPKDGVNQLVRKPEVPASTVFGRVISGWDVLAKLQRREAPPAPIDGVPQPPTDASKLPADVIVQAKVTFKRDHAYEPKKLTNDSNVSAAAGTPAP